MENNVIYGINGPVVTVKDADCFEMRYMKKQPVLNREMLLQVQAHL